MPNDPRERFLDRVKAGEEGWATEELLAKEETLTVSLVEEVGDFDGTRGEEDLELLEDGGISETELTDDDIEDVDVDGDDDVVEGKEEEPGKVVAGKDDDDIEDVVEEELAEDEETTGGAIAVLKDISFP